MPFEKGQIAPLPPESNGIVAPIAFANWDILLMKGS